MNNNIEETVVNRFKNDDSKELINLMRKKKVSDGVIMLTLFGIGTHTEYYRVLYNRINNQNGEINDKVIKKLAIEIFHEIDRNDPEEKTPPRGHALFILIKIYTHSPPTFTQFYFFREFFGKGNELLFELFH